MAYHTIIHKMLEDGPLNKSSIAKPLTLPETCTIVSVQSLNIIDTDKNGTSVIIPSVWILWKD